MGLHWGRALKAVLVGVTSQFFSSSIIPATSRGKTVSILGLWEVENDLSVKSVGGRFLLCVLH